MKSILLFLILLFTFLKTGLAVDNNTLSKLDYPSPFLMQWIYNCSEALKPSYEMRGIHPEFAIREAIMKCACVVDKFRLNFSQTEVGNMDTSDRRLWSEKFTQECLYFRIGI